MQTVEERAAHRIIEKHAEVVLAGQYGPTAYKALSAAGIEAVGAVHGTVKDFLEANEAEDYECPMSLDADPWWNWR